MAGQASELFGTPLFAVVCTLIPGVFVVFSMMTGAPGEWGRGVLTAYVAVLTATIAGATSGSHGVWTLGIAILGFLAIIVGGPWGLLISSAGAAALVFSQLTIGSLPIPVWFAPAITVMSIAAAIRGLI